jgi:hypothetical protein
VKETSGLANWAKENRRSAGRGPRKISKADQIIILTRERNELKAKIEETLTRYDELLFAVERKWQGETRHETALRYIRETEALSKVQAASQEARGEK